MRTAQNANNSLFSISLQEIKQFWPADGIYAGAASNDRERLVCWYFDNHVNDLDLGSKCEIDYVKFEVTANEN